MKKFLHWNGRMGRYQFFACSLLGGLGLGIIVAILGSVLSSSISYIIALLVSILLIYLNTCWAIQRLHDLDKPAWLVVFYIVPYKLSDAVNVPDAFLLAVLAVFAVSSIYLLFFKGTAGSNQHGPDPTVTTFPSIQETKGDA